MRTLGVPFGEICREQYVLRQYGGGWGIPEDGIDLIEPGSVSPLPDSIIDYQRQPILFEADLLQPVGSSPLDVSWSVNGVPVASGEENFSYSPPGGGTYEVELRVRDTTPFVLPRSEGELESRRRWTVRSNECVASDTTLCLQDGRFQIEVVWRDFTGNDGDGEVVMPVVSDDSGLFFFFNPDNWEMLVKVLDACGVNGRFWVFLAATTNLEYTLSVRDSATGVVRSYDNPLGIAACRDHRHSCVRHLPVAACRRLYSCRKPLGNC